MPSCCHLYILFGIWFRLWYFYLIARGRKISASWKSCSFDLFAYLLQTSLMRFSADVGCQCGVRIKPLGAFYTIVSTEIGEFVCCFGILELTKMLRGGKISFYLINIPYFSSRLCDGPFARNTHGTLGRPWNRLIKLLELEIW